MLIGIIGAMDEEIELLLNNMEDKRELNIANCLFIKGIMKGKTVVLLKSGIGKVNAAMATTILHEQFSPSLVINTGSAGGFSSNLEVGDIVISRKVVHYDVDVTAFNYSYGQVPGLPPMYDANEKLIMKAEEIVKELGINFETGLIATGDSFMENPDHVAFVREKFPSMIASEMEAAAVSQVCYQYGTPFIIIRALSDIAGKDSSLSFDAFLEKAAKNAANIVMGIISKLD